MRWEDSSLAVGVASILLPSAAEGSCPVELGNPPILALTLMRHKGCTVLRIRFQLHQCGALKSHSDCLYAYADMSIVFTTGTSGIIVNTKGYQKRHNIHH